MKKWISDYFFQCFQFFSSNLKFCICIFFCGLFMNFFRISRQIPEKSDVCRFFNRICENKLDWKLDSLLFNIIHYYSLFFIRVLRGERFAASPHVHISMPELEPYKGRAGFTDDICPTRREPLAPENCWDTRRDQIHADLICSVNVTGILLFTVVYTRSFLFRRNDISGGPCRGASIGVSPPRRAHSFKKKERKKEFRQISATFWVNIRRLTNLPPNLENLLILYA